MQQRVAATARRGAGEGPQALILAAAMLAVVIWGATPMVTKVAVGAVDPLAVGLLRTLIGALAALPLIVVGRLGPPTSRGARAHLAVSALGGFVLFPLVFSLGIERTSAGHGALLLGILPVLTGLIAAILERRLPGTHWWVGCAVAVAGTVILVGERFGLDDGTATIEGDVLVLSGALCAAAGYVTGARAAREIGTWPVTLWGLVIGGCVLLPLAPVVVSPAELRAAGPAALGGIAYLAVITSIVGYAAWYWALGRGGIGRTSLAQFLLPIVGVLLAVAVLREPLTWPMIVAAATILAGVALARGRA